jgi:Transposase DDE domain
MERERWEIVYRMLVQLDKGLFRGLYRPAVVLAVYFWAVIHDRPICWACQRKHWPAGMAPCWRLPSQPTMSRRLRDPRMQALLAAVEAHPGLATPATDTPVKMIDAKPLPVSGYSKDPDARWGYAVRGLLKGYKLFAIWGNGPFPLCWCIGAMNVSEQRMAEEMIPQLRGRGSLLGDKAYDINKLYEAAGAVGHQLLADRKRPQAGLGHRRHSPARLQAIRLLQTPAGRRLYRLRSDIERQFGGLSNFGGGLAPLPSWVRRLPRVQRWVQAKLIINALRINHLRPLTAVA